MEGFTLALALVDAIPVLSFGISMVIIASRFQSPLFMIGAALSVLGGCCKVAWKLVLGIAKKDLRWLNKPFVPMMASGFLLLVVSVILNITKINWAAAGGFRDPEHYENQLGSCGCCHCQRSQHSVFYRVDRSHGLHGLVPEAQIPK